MPSRWAGAYRVVQSRRCSGRGFNANRCSPARRSGQCQDSPRAESAFHTRGTCRLLIGETPGTDSRVSASGALSVATSREASCYSDRPQGSSRHGTNYGIAIIALDVSLLHTNDSVQEPCTLRVTEVAMRCPSRGYAFVPGAVTNGAIAWPSERLQFRGPIGTSGKLALSQRCTATDLKGST